MNGLLLTPLSTFSGLRKLPLLSLTYNTLNPLLAVDANGVELRVVRRHRWAWSEIERIEIDQALPRHGVTFVPKAGWRTFTASFVGRTELRRALEAIRLHAPHLRPAGDETTSAL